MAFAQNEFEEFHRKILLDLEANQDLRDKRDTLLSELKDRISDDAPSYRIFHQGSYELSTGVKPLHGDPDMDVGISFNCKPEDFPDSLDVKKYVKKAIERHNRTVKIKTPCVTVQYIENDEPKLHVDFAVYSEDLAGNTYLAIGKESNPSHDRIWRQSDAEGLTKTILDKFEGGERNQWRRIVRALKRWRDLKIGHGNIPSIGLTVAAWKWFQKSDDPVDGQDRDLEALLNLVNSMLNGWALSRLYMASPVAPWNDLFGKCTLIQMDDFKQKLEKLRDSLKDAMDQADTHEACKILRNQFGDDFPVPEKENTTKNTVQTFQTTGRSA